jgi:Lrp/AsnC family transcriptional regulator
LGKSLVAQLDSIDIRILECLQADASLSLGHIAGRVHLSQNACWSRIRKLEENGVIRKRVALLDPAKVGAGLTVFVLVKAAEHSEAWFEQFSAAVRNVSEVVEFYRTSGEIDYVLKLQVADVASYDESYKQLIRSARCTTITAVFAMEELKHTTAVPLPSVHTR